jgi:hypothetical protein
MIVTGEKTKFYELKSVSVPLYSPQIPHEHSRCCVKGYKKMEAKEYKRKMGKN